MFNLFNKDMHPKWFAANAILFVHWYCFFYFDNDKNKNNGIVRITIIRMFHKAWYTRQFECFGFYFFHCLKRPLKLKKQKQIQYNPLAGTLKGGQLRLADTLFIQQPFSSKTLIKKFLKS